jgi:ATP-binding protein involved in chromosome partitioning
MLIDELEAKLRRIFTEITHPQYRKTLSELAMYDKATIDGEKIDIFVSTPDEVKEYRIEMDARIRRKLQSIPPQYKIHIHFNYDPDLNKEVTVLNLKKVKHIIAVGSGKGGVGKSTVSANLAAALKSKGFNVGLVDTDVYGPSVGKLFGYDGAVELTQHRRGIIAPIISHGIKLMSFSFMLHPEQALIWRGPLLNNAVHQLLFEIEWGELDYLIVDLPPGTGDVQLSLAQMTNLTGAIVVSTPQSVAILDAQRAITMFRQVGVPVIGLIENMSEFICPKCGHVSHIFSKAGVQKISEAERFPLLGSVPLMTEIMESGEAGLPIVLKEPQGAVAQAYYKIAESLVKICDTLGSPNENLK